MGFKYWRVTEYGRQAMRMLAVFGSNFDEATLRQNLRREQAEDALEVLRRLQESGDPITDERLDRELDALHGRGGG